jgi:hypothetical protein
MEPRVPVALPRHEQQATGESVRATNINSLPLDKMLKVSQCLMDGAVLEETKIVAIIKIVLNHIEQNDHQIS